jgi:hypothetical protein
MKTLNFEQMENLNAGMGCGWAIGIAAFSGLAIIGATIVNPAIWVVPQTYYGAATLITGNTFNVSSSCE